MTNSNHFSLKLTSLLMIIILLVLSGCGQNGGQAKPAAPGTTAAQSTTAVSDKVTKIKVGMPTASISYLPWYVADRKGIFKKHNLEVQLERVSGGVIGLRALQTGDFQFLGGLPESVITGVSEGANAKLIGALMAKSVYSVFVSPEIEKAADLKGKAGAVVQPGNGTDTILRWWLKEQGLEPDKDVRILAAGGNPERVQALKTGQAQVTLLSPPTDLKAEAGGLKRLALIRDVLPTYNHDCIAANGTLLKENPEVARAFMAATAEAIAMIRDESNRAEITKIGMEALEATEADFTKSLEFALPSYGDKGKLNVEGIKFAIETAKQSGNLKKDISVEDVVDESYYAQ